jgi:hypothetical protein
MTAGSKEKVEKIACWKIIHQAHPDGRKLADNHYSRKTKGATQFVGPGEKLVLITQDKKALFAWRKNIYRQDGQKGIECSIFRNEGCMLSSMLIKKAVKLAREKWGSATRFFTYVNPSAIKSTNPGYCFLKAGWKKKGTNKDGRLILLEAPEEAP